MEEGTITVNKIVNDLGKITGVELLLKGEDTVVYFWLDVDGIKTVYTKLDTVLREIFLQQKRESR